MWGMSVQRPWAPDLQLSVYPSQFYYIKSLNEPNIYLEFNSVPLMVL